MAEARFAVNNDYDIQTPTHVAGRGGYRSEVVLGFACTDPWHVAVAFPHSDGSQDVFRLWRETVSLGRYTKATHADGHAVWPSRTSSTYVGVRLDAQAEVLLMPVTDLHRFVEATLRLVPFGSEADWDLDRVIGRLLAGAS